MPRNTSVVSYHPLTQTILLRKNLQCWLSNSDNNSAQYGTGIVCLQGFIEENEHMVVTAPATLNPRIVSRQRVGDLFGEVKVRLININQSVGDGIIVANKINAEIGILVAA